MDNSTDFSHHFTEYMQIKIFVDSADVELKNKYISSAFAHNEKILQNPDHYDAGFDMYLPTDTMFGRSQTECVDYKLKCRATMINSVWDKTRATAFYTYARSSISNTPLRLANNQGIIDAGYRGNLMSKFDNLSDDIIWYTKFHRFMQICAPNLMPIFVRVIDTVAELGQETSRGEGGFGSTGV